MTTAAGGDGGGVGVGGSAMVGRVDEGSRTSSSSVPVPPPPPPMVNHRSAHHSRQETHRIYLQQRRRPSPPGDDKASAAQHRRGGQQHPSSGGGGPTTLSAAVRLTDSATCGDVTNLLRRKFHLGPLPRPGAGAVKGGPISASTAPGGEDGDGDDGGDALVLVGTLHDLPPDHVQFFDGEHDGAAAAAMMTPCPACEQERGRVTVTGAADSTAANGSTSAAPVPGGGGGGVASALGYGTGFFFSGSGGSNNGGNDSAEEERRRRYQQKMAAAEVVANIVEAIDGHSCHLIRHNCDVTMDVVRTVRSDENPLSCRDEMVRHLRGRHRDAWDVFFSNLFHRASGAGAGAGGTGDAAVVERMVRARRRQQRKSGRKKPRTTMRWFFQPRFDHPGRVDDDPDAMRPTAFVELDGYCTADDGGGSSSSDEDDDDVDGEELEGGSGRGRLLGESSSHPGAWEEDGDADSTHAEVGRSVEEGGVVVDHPVENGEDHGGGDFGGEGALPSSLRRDDPSDGTSTELTADHGDLGRPSDGKLHLHPHYNPRTTVELRRRATLQRLRSESSNGGSGRYSVGGYLLRQSRSDPNVWRRVYCVLVDDRLWYVSRMRPLVNPDHRSGRFSCVRPYFEDGDASEESDECDDCCEASSAATEAEITIFPTQMPTKETGAATATCSASAEDPSCSSSSRRPPSAFSPPRCAMCSRRIGRYRSIRLCGARVSEPRPGSPHSTLPNGIVIRESKSTNRGGSVVHHYFRAERGRDAQLRWIQALADRIVTLHEDGYMDLAECMICDAEEGRARRMEMEVVAPCAGMTSPPAGETLPVPRADGSTGIGTGTGTGTTGGIVPRRMGGGGSGGRRTTTLWSMTGNGAEFVDLVRFGMLVQAYREKCRHYEEWCRHGVGIGDHGGGAVGGRAASNGGNGIGPADGVDGETASVKAIKLARRGRLEESIRLISRLWDEAAHVCSMSDVSVSVSSSTERDAEEMEQALRRIDTLRAEITFRVQENADCGLRAYRAILTDDGRGLPEPPPIDLFDEMVRRRIELVQMVEKRYEEHGLFGHDSSML